VFVVKVFNKIVVIITILGLIAYNNFHASDAASSSQPAAAAVAPASSASSAAPQRGVKRQRDESQETAKNIFLAHRAALLGKVQVIKNELKRLVTLSNNKFVRNFIETLRDDANTLSISNSEELVEKLNDITRKLDQIKAMAGITESDSNAIDEVQKKIKSLRGSYKKSINLSALQKPNEELDLNETEIFTQDSFIDLITAQQKKNLPFLLARVEYPGGAYYYDAHSLNKYIFNQYPLYPNRGKWNIKGQKIEHKIQNEEGDWGIQQAKDILNKTPLMVDSIHYFTISSLKDPEFTHVGSFNDLITQKDMQEKFYENAGLAQSKAEFLLDLLPDEYISSFALSKNNQLLGELSGGSSYDPQALSAAVYDISQRQPTLFRTLKYDINKPTSIALAEDNSLAVVGYEKGLIALFDLRKNELALKPIQTFSDTSGYSIDSLVLSSDNNFLITSSFGDVIIWGMNNSVITNLDHQILEYAHVPQIVLHNGFIYTGSSHGKVDLWSLTGSHIRQIIKPADEDEEELYSLYSIAVSSSARYIVVGYIENQMGDYGMAKIVYGPDVKILYHDGGVTSVAISTDEKYAITGSRDKTAVIWNLRTGKKLLTIDNGAKVTSVAISADNKQIFVGTEQGLKIWKISIAPK